VEAAQAALISGGMTSCDLVLVFATVGYDQQELLRGVRSVTGNSALAGCTGEGVITQTGPAGGMAYKLTGPERGEERVGVMAFSSDVIRFRTAAAGDLRRDSRAAGLLGQCHGLLQRPGNRAGRTHPLRGRHVGPQPAAGQHHLPVFQ
jgi:hypothetical protein